MAEKEKEKENKKIVKNPKSTARKPPSVPSHLFEAHPEGMSAGKLKFAIAYVENGFSIVGACRSMGKSEGMARGWGSTMARDPKVKQFVAKLIAEQMEQIELSAKKVVSHVAQIMLDPGTSKAEQLRAANLLMKHYNGFEDHQKAGRALSDKTNEELNEQIKMLSNRLHGKQHKVKGLMDDIENAQEIDFTETYEDSDD